MADISLSKKIARFAKRILALARRHRQVRRLEQYIRFRDKAFVSIGDNNSCFFRPGWKTVDLVGADFLVDVRKEPLPFCNDSLDAAHCSHLIEHVDEQQGLMFCKEIYRCLKPGGVIRLATPDMDLLIDRYLARDWKFFLAADGEFILRQIKHGRLPPESLLMQNRLVGWFASYSGRLDTGGGPLLSEQQVDEALENRHKYDFREWCVSQLEPGRVYAHVHVYDYVGLRNLLQAAGFKDVQRHGYGESDCGDMRCPPIDVPQHRSYSLYVEARK